MSEQAFNDSVRFVTPGQTVGPFFGFGLPYPGDSELVAPFSPGAVLLTGAVYDGNGDPVPDSLLEIWQADTDGSIPDARGSLHRDGYTFTGFGRAAVDQDGVYRFWTREPGAAEGRARFISLIVYARGLLDKLHTRIYLPGDDAALESDPLLSQLSAQERATLVARRADDGSLRHDIHLQGERETVFIDFT